ncbi:MAG: hypothetical protein RL722_2993, partial [Pseudomonadota bacterium]
LAAQVDGQGAVLGLGPALCERLAPGRLPALQPYTAPTGSRVALPASQADLWLWLRGDGDAGALLHQARAAQAALAPALVTVEQLTAFRHRAGHDLTGYEDGTENPVGEDALAAACVAEVDASADAAPAGSSFVAVQRWQHDFGAFEALGEAAQDQAIGRRRSDNEELDDAPDSAHVRRTAQEDFAPEAFLLRRSMPWIEADRAGLHFVAFGASLAPFQAQLRRMSGAEDGIVDALFRFSRPLGGAYYWCPPLAGGRPDLSLLGL